MNLLIHTLILIPIIGFLLSLLISQQKENSISLIAWLTPGINSLLSILFVTAWLVKGAVPLNIKDLLIFKSSDYEFLLDFYFDKITAVFLTTGAFLTCLIALYSRYYLHRESGYKRFFNTLLIFYAGYNLTIFAGNFETLMIGWEILGISSFLLIAFYRDRYLPVKNAVKVFSIYRIGDVGLLLAMWASHHLWHQNITFSKLNNFELVHTKLLEHSSEGLFISLMLLITASAKSAQLPFSSWLPRAMEGPTPSSAIFYGSLSVHIGVFLLLRTLPFWEHQYAIRVLTIILGICTAIIAHFIARVQSSVKSQVAYNSIAQIGIIFIEIALGWQNIALIHFVTNAFLRTYQLLTSPSMVAYAIREQFYHFKPRNRTIEDSLPKKLENSLYILSVREWNLDLIMYKYVFGPLKSIGHKLDFLTPKNVFYYFIPFFTVGVAGKYFDYLIPANILNILPTIWAFIGLIMGIKSFSEKRYPRLAWFLAIMSHCWIALAIAYNEKVEFIEIELYLSGVLALGIAGIIILQKLKKTEPKHYNLFRYNGHVYEHRKMAFAFFVSCLGVMGFPITGTFIGEDLLFSHIREHQILLAFINALSYIIGGIALIRLYARLFLGPHAKTYHETALPSS
jgi:NADH:ubiquinone oxidoreductase subunit 5 (subunit L)/multisubunit Na+/H+ antiporter MnhA subunit